MLKTQPEKVIDTKKEINAHNWVSLNSKKSNSIWWVNYIRWYQTARIFS